MTCCLLEPTPQSAGTNAALSQVGALQALVTKGCHEGWVQQQGCTYSPPGGALGMRGPGDGRSDGTPTPHCRTWVSWGMGAAIYH